MFKAEPTQLVIGTAHSFKKPFEHLFEPWGYTGEQNRQGKPLPLEHTGSQCRNSLRHSVGSWGDRRADGWGKVLRGRLEGGGVGRGNKARSCRTLYSYVRSWNFILSPVKNNCRVLSRGEA